MKLNPFQRRVMLLSTSQIFYNGVSLTHVRYRLRGSKPLFRGTEGVDFTWLEYCFVGDVLQINQARQNKLEAKNIGPTTWLHIEEAVKELTGLPMGTEFDKITLLAFAEAKVNLVNGISPQDAWPAWYVSYVEN